MEEEDRDNEYNTQIRFESASNLSFFKSVSYTYENKIIRTNQIGIGRIHRIGIILQQSKLTKGDLMADWFFTEMKEIEAEMKEMAIRDEGNRSSNDGGDGSGLLVVD